MEALDAVIVHNDIGPIGTARWCGTVDGYPAMALSYYGGASLWTFYDQKWHRRKFESYAQIMEFLGVIDG